MIIFEKFGGGQAKRERNFPAFSGHAMGSVCLSRRRADRRTEPIAGGRPALSLRARCAVRVHPDTFENLTLPGMERGCGHSPRRDTMSRQITTRLFPRRSKR